MNRTEFIGNLTADPIVREVRMGQETVKVCSFDVAVNERYRDRTGNVQNNVTYYRVSAWRQLGEICQQYLAKGRRVYVSGTVRASAYINQQGQAAASLEVNAQTVEFLSPNPNQQNNQPAAAPAAMPAANRPAAMPNYGVGQPVDPNGGFQPIETDELPF